MTTGQPKHGKRVQIYLPADLLERWERMPRYERSATVARALRKYWEALDALIAAQASGKENDMKARFQARIRRGEWYDAARILIDNCEFHGFETDEIDTWLANGDVAYINSRGLQELVDAYCDMIRVTRYTIEE